MAEHHRFTRAPVLVINLRTVFCRNRAHCLPLSSYERGLSTVHSHQFKQNEVASAILRTFEFDGFLESIAFVNRIAKKAQRMNHHPDIEIQFNKVTLTLTTHDEGGITEKDFTLARQCDKEGDKQ